MANALYDFGRQGFLEGTIDWDTDTIKAVLVRSYTVNLATHDNLDDITGAGGGTIVSTSPAFSTKSVTAGVADAADITFSTVTAGASCPYIIIYKDTGTASTSRLIAYIDQATNLPVTPNGGDIVVAWDSGANKIFKL
jgi:hypothetical protein